MPLTDRLGIVARHPRVLLAGLVATAGSAVQLARAWPDHGVSVFAAAVAVAIVLMLIVPSVIDRRVRVFRGRDEVERVLKVRVLASVPAQE